MNFGPHIDPPEVRRTMYNALIIRVAYSWQALLTQVHTPRVSFRSHSNHASRHTGVLSCVVFTAQCTLVQMRGLGIACRLSVRLSVRL